MAEKVILLSNFRKYIMIPTNYRDVLTADITVSWKATTRATLRDMAVRTTPSSERPSVATSNCAGILRHVEEVNIAKALLWAFIGIGASLLA
jgi:hypothetical protein